ncbi:MAG: hypothetical protein ACP5GO_03010 [Thermoprotei archaeon]
MVSGRVFPYLNGAIRFLQGREDQVGILSFSVELLNGLPFLPGLGGYLGGRPCLRGTSSLYVCVNTQQLSAVNSSNDKNDVLPLPSWLPVPSLYSPALPIFNPVPSAAISSSLALGSLISGIVWDILCQAVV